MTQKIIIANWKMNQSFSEAEKWLESMIAKIKNQESLPQIILCPPAVFLEFLDQILLESEMEQIGGDEVIKEGKNLEDQVAMARKIFLGGQDCHASQVGAFTGDVSARMLLECGCKFVILGHSERRRYHNEDNSMIAKKIRAAVENNLVPILCVGESLDLRKNKQYYDFIAKQIDEAIVRNLIIENLIIAYEPIWSIGTDLTPEISQIDEMAHFIKVKISKYDNVKNSNILYGGSVKSSNSKKILGIRSINGLLVGNSSLNVDEFAKITF